MKHEFLNLTLRRLTRVVASTLVATLCGHLPLAQAAANAIDPQADQQTLQANDQLLREAAQFDRLPAAAQPAAVARLVQLATQRKQVLLRQLQADPQQAALRLLPEDLRSRLPAAVQAQLERRQSVRGQAFELIEDDFSRGLSRSQLMLQTEGQTRPLRVHLSDPAASLRDAQAWTGRRVQMRGARLDDEFIVLDKREVTLLAADGTNLLAVNGTLAAVVPVVQGLQNTLVVLTDFTDKPLACSSADVNARMFGSSGATVNRNHVESSQGLVGFTGRVIGPFRIPYTSTGSCDFQAWGEAAEAAAKAAGVDTAVYDRVSYLMAGNTQCGWTGIAYVPGRRSWVNRCESTGTISHELGHNLGFQHATTPGAEYGDASDPMGAAKVVQHNAANRVMAGWLAAASVVDVASGGSFTLAPLELVNPGNPQVLRVAKPDTAQAYYLSLRQAINLDASLATPYLNTLSVHKASGELPGSPTTLLASLAPGQTFNDSANGLAFTLQGVSGSLATVAVSKGGASCVRAAPALNLSPTSLNGKAGSGLSYTMTVSNRNSSACGTGAFDLSTVLPSSFAASLGLSRLTVAPGASASTTVTLTSPTSATVATYTFSLKVADSGLASNSATVQGAYVVSSLADACTRVAPLLSLSPTSKTGAAGSRQYYTAVVTNRNALACGSGSFALSMTLPSGFSGTFTSSTVTVAPGSTVSMSLSLLSPASAAAASYAFTVKAADAALPSSQASAAGSFVVTAGNCVRATPTLRLSPTLKTGIAGSRQYYTAVLTNNNSSGCGTGSFDLSATAPSGFTHAFTLTRVVVATGSTLSASMSVVSPLTAAVGNHVFTVKAADAALATSAASSQGTYAVVKP